MNKQLTPEDIDRLMQAMRNVQEKDDEMLREIRKARQDYLQRQLGGMDRVENINKVMDWIRDSVNKWGITGFTGLLTMLVLDGVGGGLHKME